jgi:hypothetical protein
MLLILLETLLQDVSTHFYIIFYYRFFAPLNFVPIKFAPLKFA